MKKIIINIIEFCNKHYIDFSKGLFFGLCSLLYTQYLVPHMSYSMQRLFWIITIFIVACWFRIKIAIYPQRFKEQQANWCFFIIFMVIDISLILYYFLSDYVVLSWI